MEVGGQLYTLVTLLQGKDPGTQSGSSKLKVKGKVALRFN
jgi:hypothetical protein